MIDFIKYVLEWYVELIIALVIGGGIWALLLFGVGGFIKKWMNPNDKD